MSKHAPVIVSYSSPAIAVRFVETLMDEARAMLIRYGESRDHADKLSREFVVEACQRLNGKQIYFGKNTLIEAQERRYRIRADFDQGENIKDLADKYQLSTRQIVAICKEIRDTVPAKAATRGADIIAVSAAKIFIKIGESAVDAASAARGLLAVITAKFGGKQFVIPRNNTLARMMRMIDVYRLDMAGYSHAAIARRFNLSEEQIAEISDAYPTRSMPETSELTKIRFQLFNYMKTFSEHDDVLKLLESAADCINQAHEKIAVDQN